MSATHPELSESDRVHACMCIIYSHISLSTHTISFKSAKYASFSDVMQPKHG